MFERFIETVLANPLAGARAADKAVGYVGLDIPTDLLLAYSGTVCHLPWDADKPTLQAEKWLESAFEPWVKSMLESWIAGEFDCFEKVIFSRGSDSAQRLYYYICELQRWGEIAGPEPIIFDTARVNRKTSVERTIVAVRKLAAALDINADALHRGIEKANAARALFQKLDGLLATDSLLREKTARASLFISDYAELADLESIAGGPPAVKRLVLAGSTPPDGRLHSTIHHAGWTVAAECHERTLSRFGPLIDREANDPFVAVGAHAHTYLPGPRAFADLSASLMSKVAEVQANAVILWLIEEDEAYLWHVRSQQQALTDANIPHLLLTRRPWNAADSAQEEITVFLKGLAL